MAASTCFKILKLASIKPIKGPLKSLDLLGNTIFYNQTRDAGHAKWQNIASTKRAGDLNKGKMISRYVLMVRRAIISNNRQANPKLNSKLADILEEAQRMNVPKATLDRAIARAVDVQIISKNIEIQGPSGCALVAQCETSNINELRREIKKTLKKFEANIMPEDTLIGMFQSKGFVRAATETKDKRQIDFNFAEEAAIVANAEEVSLENNPEAKDDNLKSLWVFSTDAANLGPCKGELEKLGLQVISNDLNLVPYRYLDLGPEIYDKVMEVCMLLKENDQVIEVFHNLATAENGKPS